MNVIDKPMVDTITLDETILDNEPPCEFRHNGLTTCTIHVHHRVIACDHGGSVCDTAAGIIRDRIVKRSWVCSGCGRNGADCWRIVPV